MAIKEMDYALNKINANGIFHLYFSVDYTISSTSSMLIYFYTNFNMVNQVTLSLIIFDNDFHIFNEAFQDLGYLAFSSGTAGSTSYTLKTTPFTAVRFMTTIDI